MVLATSPQQVKGASLKTEINQVSAAKHAKRRRLRSIQGETTAVQYPKNGFNAFTNDVTRASLNSPDVKNDLSLAANNTVGVETPINVATNNSVVVNYEKGGKPSK